MSTDRDDVLSAFAEGRSVAEELGLRRFRVYLRRRTWRSGAAAPWAASRPGVGYPCDVEVLVTPAPKVADVSVRHIASSGGTYRDGDLFLSKITPRREPGTGLELHQILQRAASGAEECHLLLLSRAGTAWHVYEGTERLLATGPHDLPSALACLNALRVAYPGHLTNTEAHLAADAAVVPGANATDLPTAITLANALRAVWVAHRASVVFHPEADPYPVGAPVATTEQELLVLTHELLRVFNLHVAPGPITEATPVRVMADRAFELRVVARPTRRTP